MIDALATLIAAGGLIAYVEWRVLPLLLPQPQPTLMLTQPEPTFICFFCKGQFALSQKETLGGYTYCPEHGHRRQAAVVAAKPPAQMPRRMKTAEADRLPWEN